MSFAGVIVLVVGILYLIVGIFLWKAKNWARMLVIAFAIIGAILALLSLIGEAGSQG